MIIDSIKIVVVSEYGSYMKAAYKIDLNVLQGTFVSYKLKSEQTDLFKRKVRLEILNKI